MVARPGARPHGDDDPTTRLRLHLYDAPLRRSCCSRCYAECRPRFRLGSGGGGLYSPTTPFFTCAGPLPRVPLVYDSWLAPLLRCPACAPVFRARQPTLDHKKMIGRCCTDKHRSLIIAAICDDDADRTARWKVESRRQQPTRAESQRGTGCWMTGCWTRAQRDGRRGQC